MLLVDHVDTPGVVGRVGQVLGSNAINIGGMQVGRKQQGGAALMIINIDKPITPEVHAELEAISEVTRITNIEF